MKITIDGKQYEAEKGEYILSVCKRNGIAIPTLCDSDALPGQGSCRLCIVEVIDRGWAKVVTSCLYPITKEVEVLTKSEKIMSMRKTIITLLTARAPRNEYMIKLKNEYGVLDEEIERFKLDDLENCILCGLCVKACEEVGINAISTVNRGVTKKISTPYDEPSDSCIGCGACSFVCPTGAIVMKDTKDIRTIWGKTFKLLKCEKCGRYFTTKENFDYVTKKLNESKREELCEDCKKKIVSEKFRDVSENINLNN
ncbi:2Fe-2S iron-sulfur cluster-binding protein [Clostridium sp.]|uniref:2Fe-2S iron-sulfur cluster-binding protein n=1 Tax=Clostridium sp. TaxID=1506 RepID=UPI003D6D4E5D